MVDEKERRNPDLHNAVYSPQHLHSIKRVHYSHSTTMIATQNRGAILPNCSAFQTDVLTVF